MLLLLTNNSNIFPPFSLELINNGHVLDNNALWFHFDAFFDCAARHF